MSLVAGIVTVPGFYTVNGSNPVQTFKSRRNLYNLSQTTNKDHTKPNRFRFQRELYVSSYDRASYWNGSSFKHYEGYFGFIPTQKVATWHDSELTAAYNQALSRLYGKIRGNLDASIDAFQVRQSSFIKANAGKAVRDTIHLLRSLNPKNWAKAIGSNHLRFQYDIKPTLQTIHDIVSMNRNHYFNVGQKFRARAQNSFPYNIGIDNWPDYTYSSRMRTECSYRCEIGVWMCIPDTPMTQLARLTSLNPLSIGWELLPWSFVADWFYNIGDYLRSLESAVIYQSHFRSGYVTTSYCEVGSQTGTRKKAYFPSTGNITTEFRLTGIDRQVLSSLPLPKPPVFKCELGSGKLLNAAALLTNFLKAGHR